MQLTVEAVAKTGKGFMSGGKWYNSDKKADLNFSNLSKGDVVEVEANDNWIKSVTVVTKGSGAAKPSYQKTGSDTGAMTRATAVKAILGSPMLAEQTKDDSLEDAFARGKELIRETVEYINTGKFPSDGE